VNVEGKGNGETERDAVTTLLSTDSIGASHW